MIPSEIRPGNGSGLPLARLCFEWRLFAALSLSAFSVLIFLPPLLTGRIAAREPFYGNPTEGNTLVLRNDPFGKGHYGASRNGGRSHKGIDAAAAVGDPILAAKSGRVVRAGEAGGYGLLVEILHPDGKRTRYAHLSTLRVRAGDWVTKGSPVGACGKTGNAGEPRMIPHVHFEIRRGEEALDPFAGLMDSSLRVAKTS